MEEKQLHQKSPSKLLRGFFNSLTEITLQDLAAAGVFQPAYGLFLDLTHALARQVEFLSGLYLQPFHQELTQMQMGDAIVVITGDKRSH